MDGNGRWARLRGKPRSQGHRAGARAVRRAVEAAPPLGIRVLTLYAFSSDNWGRPETEVALLMKLFERHLRAETANLAAEAVRLSVIGRRDRLGTGLRRLIHWAESATASGTRLHLRLAIDYSSRDAIAAAASRLAGGAKPSREEFGRELGRAMHAPDGAPDVDLLIRTGGEQRLSDFLLWECAYAELVFSPRLWPDFTAADLAAAVTEFQGRERRFGRLSGRAAG
jgi:undecaprenyl diphosphate synthase